MLPAKLQKLTSCTSGIKDGERELFSIEILYIKADTVEVSIPEA